MAEVVLASRTGVRLTLSADTETPSAPGESTYRTTLTTAGLTAGVPFVVAGWQPPPSLPAFLHTLDEDWQGWDGERRWASAEAELTLTARHDKTNTVLVDVVLTNAGPAAWECAATLELDPGAFREAADAAGRLIATP